MDTIYRPADTDNDILRKILVQYGGFPRPGDFDNSIYRKILTQLGGTFRPGDGTSELLRKIATRLGAGPLPGDTTNKLLYRIDQSLAAEPRPGDYDNVLLRKWLSPNALVPTPGTTIGIVPKVNPPATQAEVTATITGGINLIGEWLGFWVLEYSTPQQNITANYQLVAAHLVTAMPFTITFPIPVPSVIPSTVCVAIVKGPTQASVSSTPYKTKGAYKQCFAYPTNFIVVNIGGPPVAPVATAATALTTTSFSANWNSSATATSYRLDVSTVNNFASFVTGYHNLNVGNVLTQSVTGLTAGTTYYFRVRAVNGFGTSSNSNIITSLTVPAAPVTTAASAITDVFFTANWNASTGASDYRLDVATDAGFTSFVSGFNNTSVGNVTNASVGGLSPGTTYYFRVRATNVSGASANSNTTSTITIPAAPVATAASSITTTTFAANWNASTGASSYRLDVATDAGFTSFVSGFNNLNVGNVTTQSVTGLTAGTTYYFRVRAVDASGTSANSNTTTTLTVPAAPTATASTSLAETSFAANWGSITSATSYHLDVATDAGFTSFVSGFNDLDVGNVLTQSVTGLTGGSTYYLRVRAVNASGTSANSNTITTLTVPIAPTTTAATSVGADSFSANWGSVTSATSYRLDVSTSNVFASFVTGYNDLNVGNVVTQSVTGLTPGTQYYYRVRAVNASGASANSNTTSVTPDYDSDVSDWISRVQGQGSDTSSSTRLAVNSFVVTVKGVSGLWSKLKRIGVYAGNDINALKAPLKKDWGNTNDGIGSFGGSGYSESTGLTGTAGSQKGLTTGVDLSAVGSINDVHVSVYSRTVGQEAHSVQDVVSSATTDFGLLIRYASNTTYFSCCSESQYTTGTDTDGSGFYIGTRTASNSQKSYRNGTLLGTNTTPSGSFPAFQVVFHCQNASSVFGDGSSKALAFYSLGLGLDATDASNLYSAVQALQTALSRQV